MIAHLRGKLIHKEPGRAIVEAAGVGYDVGGVMTSATETLQRVAKRMRIL